MYETSQGATIKDGDDGNTSPGPDLIIYGDNQSVLYNTTIPESTIKKI